MKTLKSHYNIILFAALLIFAYINLAIKFIGGYLFTPSNNLLYILVYTLIVALLTALGIKLKPLQAELSRRFGAWLLPVSIIFAISVIFLFNVAFVWKLFCAILPFIACGVISFLSIQRRRFKISLAVCGGIIFLPLWPILALSTLMYGFGENTTLEVKPSPSGIYIAEIVSSDQGALGGDTIVLVQENRSVDLLVGRLTKPKQRIWTGDWGYSPSLEWQNDWEILIDGISYSADRPYSIKNQFTKALRVYIPSRSPDFFEDTHGGFLGDGDLKAIFYLSENEKDELEKDFALNAHWKKIDEEASRLLFGYAGDGYYSGGYVLSNVPKIENGLFCIYNKQTKTHQFPDKDAYSHNYIIALYDQDAGNYYIYNLDT